MGKVHSRIIKRLAREVIEKYPNKFSTNFEDNKKAIDEIMTSYSHKMRNQVAGYIGKLKKIEARKQSVAQVSLTQKT